MFLSMLFLGALTGINPKKYPSEYNRKTKGHHSTVGGKSYWYKGMDFKRLLSGWSPNIIIKSMTPFVLNPWKDKVDLIKPGKTTCIASGPKNFLSELGLSYTNVFLFVKLYKFSCTVYKNFAKVHILRMCDSCLQV